MNKSKIFFLSSICIVIFLAIVSSVLQLKTSEFEKNIRIFNDEISRVDVEIKILKTEVSHLTSITRIKDISNKYLTNYKNISPNDFINIIDIPVNPQFE